MIRKISWNVFALLLLFCCVYAPIASGAVAAESRLDLRPVQLDQSGHLLPWGNNDSTYDRVLTLAWGLLKRVPVQANGLRTYLTFPRFVGVDGGSSRFLSGISWAHNPAGLITMLTDSALAYYAYSSDAAVIELAREALDQQLARGTTSADDAWASVPYASSEPGSTTYRGGDDTNFCNPHAPCGRGDGVGIIEPDKVGELGYQYLRFYERSGNPQYLQAALACANALARFVRAGDYARSPWPFRVDAKTNTNIREEYSANVLGPVMLFDELLRLHKGNQAAFARARGLAWNWLMQFPMVNNNWSGYFEDIEIHRDPSENPNQYTPLETARYILLHPEMDKDWREHSARILKWVTDVFAGDVTNVEGRPEAGIQFGAEVISEQKDDLDKMSSHTARFASVLALYSEKTGDESARERAYRSFNWASYFCRDNGIVKTSIDEDTGFWFSDGYGDYMRHFLSGMAAQPDWAPSATDHLLRSSSIVRKVVYKPGEISYATFDSASTEVLRLRVPPRQVLAGGRALPQAVDGGSEGFVVEPLVTNAGGFVVRIRHEHSGDILIRMARGRRGD